MKLVIQRVNSASVSVDRKIVGKIDKGLFVLVGVKEDDSKDDADVLAEKLKKLRIMADENDKMNLSLQEDQKLLVVSQFTLHADTSKGNRPSFVKAADPKKAKEIYEYFISSLKRSGAEVETGEFGAYMLINTELDGPVTIILEH
jgi:D-tyrosyl-tRNA(Tyr) deacylase